MVLVFSFVDSARKKTVNPFLGKNSVHLWWSLLDVDDRRLKTLSALLSKEEAERAKHYISKTHGCRFTAARGMLRRLLGFYLEMPPREVPIARDGLGKPYLANAGGLNPINFNLSHSGGMALFGLTVDRRIGVDLECLRTRRSPTELSSRFFDSEVAGAVAEAPESIRLSVFLRYWTVKEAYLKASGEGIRRLKDLRTHVPLGENSKGIIKKSSGNGDVIWTFLRLSSLPNHEAAAVAEGENLEFSVFGAFE